MSNITKKTRINKFDNLKGLAIILIVLGHICTLGTKYENVVLIKNFVFIFHLPIFFFVAGYFSKIGSKETIKSTKRILIPYLIFCIIYKLFVYFILGRSTGILFIEPEYMLWFLISLFTMKLFLPILNKLKYPVITVIILALLIGLIPIGSNILGITRTFAFLPAFMIGFKYKDYKKSFDAKYPKLKEILENNKVLICLLILSLIICIIIAWQYPLKIIEVKYHYAFKSNLGVIKEIIARFIVIFMGIVVTLLLNKLMTNKKTILTKPGINSMAVYILHVFFLIIGALLIIDIPLLSNNELIFLVFAFIYTGIIVLITSRDVINKYLNKFTDKVYDLLFKGIKI